MDEISSLEAGLTPANGANPLPQRAYVGRTASLTPRRIPPLSSPASATSRITRIVQLLLTNPCPSRCGVRTRSLTQKPLRSVAKPHGVFVVGSRQVNRRLSRPTHRRRPQFPLEFFCLVVIQLSHFHVGPKTQILDSRPSNSTNPGTGPKLNTGTTCLRRQPPAICPGQEELRYREKYEGLSEMIW